MKQLLTIITLLALAGCAGAPPRPAYNAEGKEAYIVTCGSSYFYKSCAEKAEEACPGGYLIDEQNSDSKYHGRDPHTGFDYGSSTSYTWKIVCR